VLKGLESHHSVLTMWNRGWPVIAVGSLVWAMFWAWFCFMPELRVSGNKIQFRNERGIVKELQFKEITQCYYVNMVLLWENLDCGRPYLVLRTRDTALRIPCESYCFSSGGELVLSKLPMVPEKKGKVSVPVFKSRKT
jgi:hypothetical protein